MTLALHHPMARFSESELDIIKPNPIKGELETLLAASESTYPQAKIMDLPASYEKLLMDPGRYNVQSLS